MNLLNVSLIIYVHTKGEHSLYYTYNNCNYCILSTEVRIKLIIIAAITHWKAPKNVNCGEHVNFWIQTFMWRNFK